RVVTERVVETLEMIDVDHDDRERFLAALGAMQLAVERILQEAPVVQSRERVAQREYAHRIAQLQVRERRAKPVGQCAQAPLRLRRSRSSLAGDRERKMQQRKH